MLLQLGNRITKVVDATEQELLWLDILLTFVDVTKQFVRQGGRMVRAPIIPKRSLLCPLTSTFPAGFTGKVVRSARKEDVDIQLIDTRVVPAVPDLDNMPDYLRDYQVEAVKAACKAGRGLIQLPTGAGKSQIAVALTSVIPVNWLFVAPEKDLMYNLAERYEKLVNDKAGLLGDGKQQLVPHFTCATIHTLGKRLNDPEVKKFLNGVDGIVFDEAHTCPSTTFYHTLQSVDAYYRFGLSGTMLSRSDNRNLFTVGAFGSIIYALETQYLIERGFLSTANIQMVRVSYCGRSGVYNKAYIECIQENARRNRIICHIAKELGEAPGLIFVRYKKHGLILQKRLREAGLVVEFIWGEKNMAARNAAIKKLGQGDLDYIVCSTIFQTGTDIPFLRTLIIACAGKSEIATIQRLGRGLRRAEGKDSVLVFDVLDTDEPFLGSPSGNRWNHRHSRERRKAYVSEGHTVTVVDVSVP